MPIQVNEAIDSDTAEKISVSRTTGSYVDGLYVENPPAVFNTLASVQQPTPEQLNSVDDGELTSNMVAFYSLKPLLTSDEIAGTIADIVAHKGQQFKIVSAGDWSSYGYSFGIGAQIK